MVSIIILQKVEELDVSKENQSLNLSWFYYSRQNSFLLSSSQKSELDVLQMKVWFGKGLSWGRAASRVRSKKKTLYIEIHIELSDGLLPSVYLAV